MTVAVVTIAASSSRLLADVGAFAARDTDSPQPALTRLEAVLGHDLADRLVSALSAAERR
jgi:hypothetical protein